MNKLLLSTVWKYLLPVQCKIKARAFECDARSRRSFSLPSLILCASLTLLSACSSLPFLDSGAEKAGKPYSKGSYSKGPYTATDKARADQQNTEPAGSVDSTAEPETSKQIEAKSSQPDTRQPKTEVAKKPTETETARQTQSASVPTKSQQRAEKPKEQHAPKQAKADAPKPKTLTPTEDKPTVAQQAEQQQKDELESAPVEAAHVTATGEADPQVATLDDQPADLQMQSDLPVTLEALPIEIKEHWVLNRAPGSSGHCALFYREQSMNDGQGQTPVQLIIDASSILFKTKSNIDLSYQQTGVTVDQQTQRPIEAVHRDTSIIFEKTYAEIIEEMQSAQQLTLSLGFWPTWPVTQTHHLEFDVSDFSIAFSKLQSCIKLEKGLH